MDVARPRLVEIGLFVLVVAAPVAVFPAAVQPFSDAKLALLLLGVALLWGSGISISRRMRLPVLAWSAAAVLAALLGTDPAGSVLGTWEGTGLLLLLACAGLVAVAPSLGTTVVERFRGLLAGTAIAVGAVAVLWNVAPSAFAAVGLDLSFNGSTIGNPVLLAIFLAAAIPALAAAPSARVAVVGAAVLGAAFAVNGERSALLLPVVAVALCAWLLPAVRRRTVIVAIALVLAGAGWALVRPNASGVASTEAQFTTVAGERQRVAELTANARAVLRRPVFGWGPGLAWNGFVASATPEEIDVATRGWKDAHALPLQMFVTTGVVGGTAFLVVAGLLVLGVARAPAERRWTAAAAIVLGLGSLYEPMTVSLTPLLFLLAAASFPEDAPGGGSRGYRLPESRARDRGLRRTVVAVFAVAVVVACAALAASALEQWGRTHFAEWSIRTSLALQPRRLSAQQELAIELALDGRAGDPRAAAEARATIASAVAQHPWDPGVRLTAADVERLLKDFDASEAWLAAQRARFPGDDLSLRADAPTSNG